MNTGRFKKSLEATCIEDVTLFGEYGFVYANGRSKDERTTAFIASAKCLSCPGHDP